MDRRGGKRQEASRAGGGGEDAKYSSERKRDKRSSEEAEREQTLRANQDRPHPPTTQRIDLDLRVMMQRIRNYGGGRERDRRDMKEPSPGIAPETLPVSLAALSPARQVEIFARARPERRGALCARKKARDPADGRSLGARMHTSKLQCRSPGGAELTGQKEERERGPTPQFPADE